MTLRPRYTYRAKTRDLRDLARIVAPHAQALAVSLAPQVEILVRVTFEHARDIITSQYADPQEKP